MKKSIKIFKDIIKVHFKSALFKMIIFVIGISCGWYLNKPKAEVITQDGGLKLPTEVQKTVVTRDEISTQLEAIGDLSTYYGEYHVGKTVNNARYVIDDIKIPGTTNIISIECTGIAKIGYDLSSINIKVDNESKKIYISVPDANILDNYIIWDSVDVAEKNSILNPINFTQYKELIASVEDEGINEMEKKNIYSKAEKHLKDVIDAFLAKFNEYSIEYM